MVERRDPRLNLNTYLLAERNELRSVVNTFLFDCQARNLTQATLRYYWQRLALAVDFLEAHDVSGPRQITPALLRAFLASLRARGLSPAYCHQHYRCLRRFCNFCAEEELVSKSPMEHVRPPRLPKDLLPPFDANELTRLLTAAGQSQQQTRDMAVLLVLLDSGVRASELLNLDVQDVNLTTGAVHVRRGKGQKDRISFVGPHSVRALAQYLNTRTAKEGYMPLFVAGSDGQRLSFYGLQSLLRRLGERAGVSPMGCHRFRKTFAIEALRAGMPLPQLAALMGHEGLAVLQRYLRLVDSDLQAAHAAYGPVAAMLGKDRKP